MAFSKAVCVKGSNHLIDNTLLPLFERRNNKKGLVVVIVRNCYRFFIQIPSSYRWEYFCHSKTSLGVTVNGFSNSLRRTKSIVPWSNRPEGLRVEEGVQQETRLVHSMLAVAELAAEVVDQPENGGDSLQRSQRATM
jgi:hypothetical protein